MSKSSAPISTPKPGSGEVKQSTPRMPKSEFEQTMYQRNLFLVMAMNMTWQLAIVVIVPVVGGHYLDDHFGTAPLWIIVGGVIALLGVIGVLKRIVSMAGQRAMQPGDKK
jgi:F0F1-type ATP synthase assembly protein I